MIRLYFPDHTFSRESVNKADKRGYTGNSKLRGTSLGRGQTGEITRRRIMKWKEVGRGQQSSPNGTTVYLSLSTKPLYRTKQESTLHEIDPLRNHPSSCVLTSFLILPRMGSGIWGVLSQFLRLKTSPSENLPAGFGPRPSIGVAQNTFFRP